MKVKLIDVEHEMDLEFEINKFIVNKRIVDIKYQTSHFFDGRDQIFSFSAMIIYQDD